MRRPIDQAGGETRAITWKADEFARSFDRLPATLALHRYAGKAHALSCDPRRSAIDGRYFAEINRYVGHGVSNLNIKLGTGDIPGLAALDGYEQAEPGDPMWAVLRLEFECERLRRALVEQRKRPEPVAELPAAVPAALPQAPGEDDDL